MSNFFKNIIKKITSEDSDKSLDDPLANFSTETTAKISEPVAETSDRLAKPSIGHNDLSCDTKLLHALGLMDHEYDAHYCQIHRQEVEDEVNAITLNLGRTKYGYHSRKFKVRAYDDGHNEYFVGNWARPECPREEMYKMIAEAAGKGDFDTSRFL